MTAPRGIDLFRLDGRTAVITGGSKGLGAAIAHGLASAGANIVVVSRSPGPCEALAEELNSLYAVQAVGIAGDVTSPAEVQRVIDKTMTQFSRLDILINNAGINIRGPIDELSFEQFRNVQQVNVEGMWLVTKAATPHLKQSPCGRVINLASTLGLVGLANRTPYATSKGAVVQMTRALALEFAPSDVMVNAICPGPFLTEMNQSIAETEEAKRSIVGAVALNRWGRLEEIQGAAIYLASDAASYTTGSMLVVDGGWTAR